MRGLHWASVKMLFNPPTPDPLFSNLRILRWEFVTESFPFLHHLAVSSLTCLEINFVFDDVPPCHIFPRCLGDLCPNIRRFRIRVRRPQVGSDEAISGLVRCWTSLQVLHCPYITLDVDAIFHLSRTPSLTNLSFALGTAIADQIAFSRSTLLFSGLRDLDISSQTWASLSTLLPHTRLPSMESFAVYTDCCPSEYTLPSCLTALRNVCTPQSLVSLKLIQSRSSRVTGSERYQLGRDDLQPCMSFGHLRRLEINTAGTVHLTDSDLLHLTSAWPGLEHLLVGEAWGWGTAAGGITPRGLLHLLERLRALCHVCLAVDTRGYSDVETARASTRAAGFAPRAPLSVNVVDSGVHPESVDALAAFFGGILQRDVLVSARYWCTTAMAGRPDAKRSQKLWEEVFAKAYERAGPQSQSHCLESAARAIH